MLKRPHVDEFLQRMGQWFECILFTASLAKVRTHTRTVLVLVHNPNKLRAKAKVSRVLANAQYLIRQMSFAFSLLLLVSSRLVSSRIISCAPTTRSTRIPCRTCSTSGVCFARVCSATRACSTGATTSRYQRVGSYCSSGVVRR